MNNIFLLFAVITLFGAPLLIVSALVKVLRKRPAKRSFRWAGYMVIAFLVSFAGCGLATEDSPGTAAQHTQTGQLPAETLQVAESTTPPVFTPLPTIATPSPTPSPTSTSIPATPEPSVIPTPTIAPLTPSPTIVPTPTTVPLTPSPTILPTPPDSTGTESLNGAPEAVSAPNPTESTAAASAGGSFNPFNTYNNPEQQDTEDTWVLNTNSKKIHWPHCRSVPKIAPHNYMTSSESLDSLLSQGYTTCGNCFQ